MDDSLSPYLEKRSILHQKVLRRLFVAIYIKGEAPNDAYNRLAKQYGIFAAEINSIRKETEAIYQSWKELLATRISDQQGKINKLEAKLKRPKIEPSKAPNGAASFIATDASCSCSSRSKHPALQRYALEVKNCSTANSASRKTDTRLILNGSRIGEPLAVTPFIWPAEQVKSRETMPAFWKCWNPTTTLLQAS